MAKLTLGKLEITAQDQKNGAHSILIFIWPIQFQFYVHHSIYNYGISFNATLWRPWWNK